MMVAPHGASGSNDSPQMGHSIGILTMFGFLSENETSSLHPVPGYHLCGPTMDALAWTALGPLGWMNLGPGQPWGRSAGRPGAWTAPRHRCPGNGMCDVLGAGAAGFFRTTKPDRSRSEEH